MAIIPKVVREYVRKTFVGLTLDEVVAELRQRGVARVNLSGDFIRTSDSVINPTSKFYVDYSVEAREGYPVSFREFVGSRYSLDPKKDSNLNLDHRKEVLHQNLKGVEVKADYFPERVYSP